MSERTPTRSAVIGLKEERRAMQEGYVFLDEKCLLLASAMLRELRRYDQTMERMRALLSTAGAALVATLARHGLQELQCHPDATGAPLTIRSRRHSLMGVTLVDAKATSEDLAKSDDILPLMYPSPEATACRDAFLTLTMEMTALAAMSGNLERLHREYRRASRRVRALQDVLLPEVDRELYNIETQLDELEQDEALGARWGRIVL